MLFSGTWRFFIIPCPICFDLFWVHWSSIQGTVALWNRNLGIHRTRKTVCELHVSCFCVRDFEFSVPRVAFKGGHFSRDQFSKGHGVSKGHGERASDLAIFPTSSVWNSIWKAGNAPGRETNRNKRQAASRRIVRCLTLRYREKQPGSFFRSICGFPPPSLIPGSKYFSEYPYMNQEEYKKTTRDSI